MRAARALQRRSGPHGRAATGRFLVEGPQAVREAIAVRAVVELFATPQAAAALPPAQVQVHLVEDDALASLAETVRPQGVVAVCALLDVPLEEVLATRPRLLAAAVDVRDPGNAGTLVRCADAAGAGGVVLAGSSVDPYNGKAVRASAGSLFHLPLVVGADPAELVRRAQAAGLLVLAATAAGEVDLDDAADDGLLAAPAAWLFGNEAHGLAVELAAQADHRVAIPLHGRAESLNLATAAAVCLYASARAQRHQPPQSAPPAPTNP